MNSLIEKIKGRKLKQIFYSEVNNHDRKICFDEFHVFDHGVNFQMDNGFNWHLNWKNEEYFELGEGRFFKNEYLSDDEVKIWNCTREWEDYLNIEIIEFKVNYIDVAQLILSSFEYLSIKLLSCLFTDISKSTLVETIVVFMICSIT